MDLEKVPIAIREACKRIGGQVPLAEVSGVSQGQISDYLCGRRKIENMTLGTFAKLFPEAEIRYFKDESTQSTDSPMRIRMMEVFDALSPSDQARCLTMVAANFGENIKKETKEF